MSQELIFFLLLQIVSHEYLPRRVILLWTIKWSPHRLSNKQPHRMDHIRLIHRETMIHTLGQRHQIPLLNKDADPFIILIPHVEIPTPAEDVTNLLRVVDVFLEKGFHFLLVAGERVGVDSDDVGVGVAPRVADGV